jgi:type IV pilus assembly protein PilX
MKHDRPFSRQRQSGIALTISLIALLLLTVIGVSGMQTTLLEERMAGNTRDRAVALQAAETALRLGERALSRAAELGNFEKIREGSIALDANSIDLYGDGSIVMSQNKDASGNPDGTITITIAQNTIPDVDHQPTITVSSILNPTAGYNETTQTISATFRVVATAAGVSANTQVQLESAYRAQINIFNAGAI